MTISQTGLNYRNRTLSTKHLGGQIKAGDRFPWFVENGLDVFQTMTGKRLTLFTLGDWSAHTAQLEMLRSPLLELVKITDQHAFLKAGLVAGLYLVRPDGYIGLSTRDVAEIHEYLLQKICLTAP